MDDNIKIGQLRSTLFVSPILYNGANFNKINGILNIEGEFVPNVQTNQIPIQGINNEINNEISFFDWEMISIQKDIKIHFGTQKIDIILDPKKDAEEDIEKKFCDKSIKIFRAIIETFNQTPNRIAYAPTYKLEYNEKFSQDVINKKVFSKNCFKQKNLNNTMFKQVYKIEEKINDKNITLNYVADAIEWQTIQQTENPSTIKTNKFLNLSLDINTMQGCGYTFSAIDVAFFLNNSPEYGKEFLEYYME